MKRPLRTTSETFGLVWLALLFLTMEMGAGFVFSQPASADSLGELYSRARQNYRTLRSMPQKRWTRKAWSECVQGFEEVLRQDREGRFADKCYYLLGRSYQALYEAFGKEEDFRSALKVYRFLVYQHSESNLADDAQYLMGLLYLKKDPALAYPELVKVGVLFPDGDMARRAAEKVAELEKRLGCKSSDFSSSEPVSKGEAKSSPGLSFTASARAASLKTESPSRQTKSPGKSPPPSGPRYIENVKYWSNEDYTRVAIYVNGPVRFKHHTLPPDRSANRPARIYLDLKPCEIGADVKTRIPIKDGFLRGVRLGQSRSRRTRVVLDIESIENFKVFSLPDPFRILVDVRSKGIRTAQEAKEPPKPQGHSRPEQESPAPVRSKKTEEPIEMPSLANLSSNLSPEVKRVVIDPGHGGRDPGAVGSDGVREKDVVLEIAKKLQSILESEVGVEVLLTRTCDRFLSLEERTAIANTRKADLFISLHVNAHKDDSIHGVETYYLNYANDAESARVAAFENAVSTKKLNDVEAILQDLMFNTKITESSQLAYQVQKNMVEELSSGYDRVRNLGVKHGPFYVLLGAEMPCVLVETAFISNEMEERRLAEESFQKALAKGIARGVEYYARHMHQVAQTD